MIKKKIILLIIILVCIISCKGDDKKDTSKENQESSTNMQENIDWQNATQISIIGLIENGMNNHVVIVTNWTSRSRVSHYVYGEYKDKLAKNLGKYTYVTGLVLGTEQNPWSKKILVQKIIELSAKPF